MLMPFRYLIKKPKQGEKMNNAQELKAHLQDNNKARMYEAKKMTKQKAINFLYKDWVEYKKHIENNFDDNYKLKETFYEYLAREIPEYLIIKGDK